ncbi:MAG TPA: response regulator [Leptospiraceae bacterium]|jgi:DNA-binding response OmpR family regulator|nr:response regulator [Leptospirales bacterium]HMU84466.1 response regulator [Leptospiraceae bacterium]HMW60854.1 response regulator [Leptospiraceae bacterium]HMX58243.1 response regulator [Leptospiraceae bacterium]HMY45319.1 response regulator [Leptospiraceae bacterium]
MDSQVLIVDDDPLIVDLVLQIFADSSHRVFKAANATEAENLVHSENISLIILDWEMPGRSGIDLLRDLKRDRKYKYLPVIMLTSRSDEADVKAGIGAGAFYYLTKPFDKRILMALVDSATNDFKAIRIREQPDPSVIYSCARSSVFEFRTPEEAVELAKWLARMCPDAQGAQLGLQEILVNAIEHGNLGIAYEEKTQLVQKQALYAEMRRRLLIEPYASRRARVTFEKRESSYSFFIEDQGEGFDFDMFLSLTPERAFSEHGRGIAIARYLCFDELDYVAPGNKVHAVIRQKHESRGQSFA